MEFVFNLHRPVCIEGALIRRKEVHVGDRVSGLGVLDDRLAVALSDTIAIYKLPSLEPIRRFKHATKGSPKYALSIGDLVFAADTRRRLVAYGPDGEALMSRSLPDTPIGMLYLSGTLYVGTRSKIIAYSADPSLEKLSTINLDFIRARDITVHKGLIVAGGEGGIVFVDPEEGVVDHVYVDEEYVIRSLASSDVLFFSGYVGDSGGFIGHLLDEKEIIEIPNFRPRFLVPVEGGVLAFSTRVVSGGYPVMLFNEYLSSDEAGVAMLEEKPTAIAYDHNRILIGSEAGDVSYFGFSCKRYKSEIRIEKEPEEDEGNVTEQLKRMVESIDKFQETPAKALREMRLSESLMPMFAKTLEERASKGKLRIISEGVYEVLVKPKSLGVKAKLRILNEEKVLDEIAERLIKELSLSGQKDAEEVLERLKEKVLTKLTDLHAASRSRFLRSSLSHPQASRGIPWPSPE